MLNYLIKSTWIKCFFHTYVFSMICPFSLLIICGGLFRYCCVVSSVNVTVV